MFGIRKIAGLSAARTAPQSILVTGHAIAADAGAGVVHRRCDGVAEENRGGGNGRTDDRQDQRIFGRRSAGLVFKHTNKSLHLAFPSKLDLPGGMAGFASLSSEEGIELSGCGTAVFRGPAPHAPERSAPKRLRSP